MKINLYTHVTGNIEFPQNNLGGKNMKKRSLLAFVLSFALILSVCTCAFCGVVASAEAVKPTFNAAEHQSLLKFDATGFVNSTSVQLYEYDYDEGNVIYTRTVASLANHNRDWNSPFVALAKTDYKASETDTLKYYFGVRATDGHGWSFGMFSQNGQGLVGGFYVVYDQKYADGTYNMPTSGVEIVSKYDNGTISVWVDGILVVENYKSAKTNMVAPVLGVATLTTGNASSLNQVNVWTDLPEELKAPVYDADKHDIVTTSATVTTSSVPLDKTIYGSVELSAAKSGTNVYDRFLLQIGHVSVNWTNANGYQDRTGKWGIYFTRGDSIDMQIPCDNGAHFYYGANYKKYSYPDSGNANYAGPYIVTYALSATNLKLWVNGIMVIDYDYNNWGTSTQFTTTLNSFVTGYTTADTGTAVATGSNYKVWTTKTPAPVIDETAQKEILSFVSTGPKANTTIETFDYSKYITDDTAVYTSVIANLENNNNDYNGPFVPLAKANYKADANDTMQYYWGVRLTDVSGWTFGLFSQSPQGIVGGYYIDPDNAYSDGALKIPDAGVKIVSKVAGGKISVWIDGTLYIDNFAGKNDVTVEEPVLGVSALFDYAPVNLSQVSVWVDNADYGYLGDLNGDMEINILDLVRAKKLSINMDGVSAFNDNVKAFNAEGTIGATELTQMRKYLMGVIDNFDVTPEYGEDTTPAEELL